MFVYFINYFNWSDSVYHPVFHEEEFSKDEFNKFCVEASDKTVERLISHNEDIGMDWLGVSKYDLLEGIVDVLCEDYGFVKLDVLGYDIEEQIVDAHNRF